MKQSYLRKPAIIFVIGISAGILCRLSDFFPYESLWSLSSIATLFGFWIVSISVITMHSTSHKAAFANTFLYLFGMTLAFYALKYLLGVFVPQFDNDGAFQTRLFLLYTGLSLPCGLGSAVLYFWNNPRWYSGILYALPTGALLAEGIACGIVLMTRHILLGQTMFDLMATAYFCVVMGKRAQKKFVFLGTLIVVTPIVFHVVYQNWVTF